jgi:hypothetical protein
LLGFVECDVFFLIDRRFGFLVLSVELVFTVFALVLLVPGLVFADAAVVEETTRPTHINISKATFPK